MKFLKGLVLVLLSFLLFLSLSIFGFAFMLNNTLLNPDFVVSELDELDVSALSEVLLSEQTSQEEEFGTALVNTITKLEPKLKEQLGAAIYSTYDYLLGKQENPELAQTLRNTLLSSDFITSVVDELDIASLAGEFISEQLTEEIPEEMEFMVGVIDDILIELEPWIKEQISTAADPVADYLLGESPSLNIVISTEPLIARLKENRENMLQALLESLPPEVAGLPPAVIEEQFDEFFEGFSEIIPATFAIDESLIGTELPANIAEALAQAEGTLEQARQYVGYFQLGYNLLIVFMLLLTLGIILIHRQVRGATRKLGSIFLTYGAFEYAGIFVAKYFTGTQLAQLPTPSQLQAWLPQLTNDFLAPLEMFSLGLLIGGVILLVVSFVYKPREPAY